MTVKLRTVARKEFSVARRKITVGVMLKKFDGDQEILEVYGKFYGGVENFEK